MKIKYIFLAIIIFMIGKIIITEICDNRPFKFKKYSSEEKLKIALQSRFPTGYSGKEAIRILEESAANILCLII